MTTDIVDVQVQSVPNALWLVLDWNLLQSMRAAQDVPAEYQCVVLDQAFHEIANKEPGHDMGAIKRFGRWASRNVDRLWVGRSPEDLFERQLRSDGKRLRLGDVIHPQFTRALRQVARQPAYDWTQPLVGARSSDPVRHRREQIDTLVRFSMAIAEIWAQNPAKRLPKLEQRGEWVRQPDLVTDLVEKYFGPRWRAQWHPLVTADPNRFALIRWARFVAWYCLRRAEGLLFKYENNFDDAHYGLLGSYTGQLGTHDKGLAEATTSIFPGVRVLTLSELVPLPVP
jgi:hypothetical protein